MFSKYVSESLAHLHKNTLYHSLHKKWRYCIRRKRQTWWNSQIGKRDYFVKTIQRGVRMRLHFDSKLAQAIYCYEFERKERQFLNSFLRQGDVFVDVGANIGLFSLIAARRVGQSGKVYVFEPTAKIYDRLCANVRLNQFSNILCLQLALSDTAGKFPFHTCLDGFDAWNSLGQPIDGQAITTEIVECDTWDNFARVHDLIGKTTMMKIDVEGWESRVLSGGSEAFAQNDAPVLQVEFTEKAARSAASSCAEQYHILQKFGYQMFTYDENSRTLIPYPPRDSFPHINLIAAKQLEKVVARLNE